MYIPREDEFRRILKELDDIVEETARLQRALDDAREHELNRRRFDERRVGQRRSAQRSQGDRRQREYAA